jgi:sucrose phosphorylase
VFKRYVNLLQARAAHPAFHPNGDQQIITGNPALFCLLRTSPDGQERVLCMHNISIQPQKFEVGEALSLRGRWRKIWADEAVTIAETSGVSLKPYEVNWLTG